jgi:large subunit ribosomal protein L25
MLKLQAKIREAKKATDYIRSQGELPAVVYGSKTKPMSISVSAKDFTKVFKEAGESGVVVLNTPSGDLNILIHDVQVDPVRENPIHADFLAIDINKAIRVKIPLEFAGVSEAVKGGLGILVKVLHEIEIEALPKDLPHGITVDISKLVNLHDRIAVKDLDIPKGVTAITKADEIVASLAAQVEEKEEVAAPVDLSTIEVMKKGKEEKEGEEGAAAAAAAAAAEAK